jgi:hypothetical protein
VNIFGDSGTINDAGAEAGLGDARGKGALLLLNGTLLEGEAGAKFSPPGKAGNVKFGLATPDPIGALSLSCRVLANFIEPDCPSAVLGNLGIRVTSKGLPA